MSQEENTPQSEAREFSFPFEGLRDHGILWAINRTLFHPRGYALGVETESQRFILYGDGDEPWEYQLPDGRENELFAAFEAFLTRVKR